MVWATLVFLGIPIWLVLGAPGGGLLNRRRFRRRPGVFPIRVRNLSTDEEKRRGKMHAVRVHDELLSNRGIALVRMVSYAVDRVARPVTPPDTSTVKGLGDEPVSLVVITDDDRESELATSREHTDIATGPFDTAETGLGQ